MYTGRYCTYFSHTFLTFWREIPFLPELIEGRWGLNSRTLHGGMPGLWICIHFMRIRIQQFFWMRIRIQVQLNQIWRKKSWRVFLSCKKHKRLLKSRKQWILCKFTLAVISNFLAFFMFLFDKFTLLEPDPNLDPGVKMNADPDPQPWGMQIPSCNSNTYFWL